MEPSSSCQHKENAFLALSRDRASAMVLDFPDI